MEITQANINEYYHMVQDKFKDISQFELHRRNKHSGPVGI